MKYFLILVGLTIFNANADDDIPKNVKDALLGDPYFDYMITCRNLQWTKMQECVDWVMLNVDKDKGLVIHGVVSSAIQGNTTYHAQSFLLENNLLYRKQGKGRNEIKFEIVNMKNNYKSSAIREK